MKEFLTYCRTSNMATLEDLKLSLRQEATSSVRQPLSDAQYSAGFDILLQGSEWTTYRDFIVPQLSQLLAPIFNSVFDVSVLEIGPGPKSVLGFLPKHLKRKIVQYAAFEPNKLFAEKLEEWCCSSQESELPLPSLESLPDIRRTSFTAGDHRNGDPVTSTVGSNGRFDIVLFCHSMYGMTPKHAFIERALRLLNERAEAMVVVFHRDGTLHVGDLVSYRTATFPTGTVRVPNDDDALDNFAPFIAGFVVQGPDLEKAVRVGWRKTCRALGNMKDDCSHELEFSSPSFMVVFTQHATKLSELIAHVPLLDEPRTIKSSMARLQLPIPIVKPTGVRQVQQCVRWALRYDLKLTVLGGGHSGQCILRNVVCVDMSAFDRVHFVTGNESGGSVSDTGCLIVVEAGCKTGDVVSKTMTRGMTVPLGSRPSVGAGLWLQGGIGHLARLHGLSCDAVVGAVLVSVESGQILCVGNVPERHQPTGAIRSEHEDELLWAMKGAGTNFGIVISVIFATYNAPTYSTRHWVVPLSDHIEARRRLSEFDQQIAKRISARSSVDVYLYWNAGQLHWGVMLNQLHIAGVSWEAFDSVAAHLSVILGPDNGSRVVDGFGLFETEMYMSGMLGGHNSGKTSSFKRCIFLKGIGAMSIVDAMVAAIETRPSPLCYLHLLQGGGAVANFAADATAFGCRDWEFACVITGVWSRDQDGTEVARDAVQWVYKVAGDLLPFSSGVYGADLGPDPRDAALAAQAFGLNRSRLARLKHSVDPCNILAYACPLPKASRGPKLIILVTGKSSVGKDYCADQWATVLTKHSFTARVVSISDTTKREYAVYSGANMDRLLRDPAYKEEHRPALTAFHEKQVQQRPWLPEAQFLHLVHGAPGIDVLQITGMRDKSPVAAFSHLTPCSRVLEVRVNASEDTRRARRQYRRGDSDVHQSRRPGADECGRSNVMTADCWPSLIFSNNVAGNELAGRFAESSLLPLLHEDLQQLADMVPQVPNFPRPGIEFRHVLDICQRPGGLNLCTSLLQSHYAGDWAKVDLLISCETGGFVYGSALAERVNKPLALVREAGKLPPPLISVFKYPSHISSLASDGSKKQCFEMSRNIVSAGDCVVVVDDVLATGRTLCALLSLLAEAGIEHESIGVLTVAEFPLHRGRDLLRRFGFGRVGVQSLLVLGGA